MKEIILYFLIFMLVYSFYIVFVYKRKNVFKKFLNGKEIRYLKCKYNIKINKSNEKKISQIIFLANSFILSTTLAIVMLFDSMAIQLLVGFFLIVFLILLVYHLIGKAFGRR